MFEWLLEIDKKLLFTLNHSHTPLFDWLMWQFSGILMWLPLYAFIIYLLVKKFKEKALLVILIVIFAIGIADYTSVHLFKEVFKRLRPCHNPLIMDSIILVKDYCGGKYGFISSHASNSFALAGISSLLLRKKYFTIIIFLWAILVSISRVYLGVHYPSDIMAGALWGSVIGFLLYKICKYISCANNGKSKN